MGCTAPSSLLGGEEGAVLGLELEGTCLSPAPCQMHMYTGMHRPMHPCPFLPSAASQSSNISALLPSGVRVVPAVGVGAEGEEGGGGVRGWVAL